MFSRIRRSALAAIAFGMLALPFVGSIRADTAPLFYVYHGDKRPLVLDQNHLAIHLDGAQGQPIAGTAFPPGLSSLGFTAADIVAEPVPGWVVLSTANTVRSGRPHNQSSASLSSASAVHQTITSLLTRNHSLQFVSPVFRDEKGNPILITSTVLIGFQEAFPTAERRRLQAGVAEGAILNPQPFPRPQDERWQIQSRDGFAVLARANTLAQIPGVTYAEPDMIVTGYQHVIPNDPGFTQSWGLRNIGLDGGTVGFDMEAPAAWDITLGSPSVIVLILDDGVQQNHPDINQITGQDFTSDAPLNPTGDAIGAHDDHGTWVAGCVSARINNSLGTTGIAPGVKIASARCHNNVQRNGTFTVLFSWVVDALNWGESIGARVSNNSNGYGVASSALEQAYGYSRDRGMVHFASAGNEGLAVVSYPSSIQYINSIGAANRFGQRSAFSNTGYYLDFLAPGEQIYTTDRTGRDGAASGDYVIVSGTSFASPFAAGIAALVISENPSFTVDEVEERMRNNCGRIGAPGWEMESGWGLVDALRALTNSNRPNLTPFRPPDWPDKIIVSAPGKLYQTEFLSTDELTVAAAGANTGDAAVPPFVYASIYVDDVWRETYPVILPGHETSFMIPGISIGTLVPGPHAIRLQMDSTNAVAESDESDNDYTKVITVLDANATPTPTPPPSPTPTPVPTPTPSPGFVPTVSVAVSPAAVLEGLNVFFTISSSAPMIQTTTVHYSMGGRAKVGPDYSMPDTFFGQVDIPAGASSANVLMHTFADPIHERTETAIMILEPGAGYRLPDNKAARKATVRIINGGI